MLFVNILMKYLFEFEFLYIYVNINNIFNFLCFDLIGIYLLILLMNNELSVSFNKVMYIEINMK